MTNTEQTGGSAVENNNPPVIDYLAVDFRCREVRNERRRKQNVINGCCVGCKKEFVKTRSFQIYCSKKCCFTFNYSDRLQKKRDRRKARRVSIPCPGCSVVFVKSGPHKMYCSEQCRQDVKNRRRTCNVKGISSTAYAEMLSEQGGVCVICKKDNKSGVSLAIDHDRRCCPGDTCCGKCVRGLLCARCNLMLGFAKDERALLQQADLYLERWENGNRTT